MVQYYIHVPCPTYYAPHTMSFILCPTYYAPHSFWWAKFGEQSSYCQILLTPTFFAIQYMHVVTHLHSQMQTHQCYTPVKKLCNEGNQTLSLAVKSSVVETEKDDAENEAWRINRIRYTVAHTYKNNRWAYFT